MKNVLALAFFLALPAAAQDWTFSAGTGPFVFGHLAERHSRIASGDGTVTTRTSVSAATRPGLSVDLDRDINSRVSTRLGATFTRAPLSIKSRSSKDGVSLDAGDLNVATFAATFVFHFNSGGSFRPYLAAGPAYALYNMEDAPKGTKPLFTGTRGRIGATAGGGIEWWWRKNVGVRGELSDIYTAAPLKRSDFGNTTSTQLTLEKPHSVHTVVALTYRF